MGIRTVVGFVLKELIQLRRDPKIVSILFIAPIVQLTILGYAATTDVRQIELVVCDLDHSAASRLVVDAFTASTYFHLVGSVAVQDDLDPWLESGRARVAVTIPEKFAADLAAGRTGRVQVVADGSDAMVGTLGLAYAHGVLQAAAEEEGARTPVDLRPKVLYNPDLISRYFMVPAVLALLIMIMTMMLSSMALVRESELGTMEQLLVTPLKPAEVLAGKLVPYAMVGTVEFLTALQVVLFWFKVPLRGSFGVLAVMTALFMACSLGLGLLVSTLSRTQQQAMMISTFVFLMPQIYLSGFIFPIQNMPRIFQIVTYAVPLRYYATALRGIFLKGIGFDVLWPQALALLALATIIFTVARLRYRRRLG
jgi:ABC-2 type transport system permease protein